MPVRCQLEDVQQLLGIALGARRLHAPQAGDELQVFDGRQLVVEHWLVGQPRRDALGSDRIGQGIDAENLDAACIRRQQPGNHAQRAGLAGPVWSQQRVELAGTDRQIEVIHHARCEGLAQASQLQRRRGRSNSARPAIRATSRSHQHANSPPVRHSKRPTLGLQAFLRVNGAATEWPTPTCLRSRQTPAWVRARP